jgi:Flp pilus assembly protein TadG
MRSHTRRRKGQTAILFTLSLVPLLGMVGLVVDIGWM